MSKNRTRGVKRRDRVENVKISQSGISWFQCIDLNVRLVCNCSMMLIFRSISSTQPGYLAKPTQAKAILSVYHRKDKKNKKKPGQHF